VIKHRRDVDVMTIMELLDEQLGRPGRRAAARVVNLSDIPDSEQERIAQ
jgi:hypothetical protein